MTSAIIAERRANLNLTQPHFLWIVVPLPLLFFLFFFLLALLQTTIAETAATKHLHRLNVLLCANLVIQNAAMGNALAAAIYVTGKSARAPFLLSGVKDGNHGVDCLYKKKDRKRGF